VKEETKTYNKIKAPQWMNSDLSWEDRQNLNWFSLEHHLDEFWTLKFTNLNRREVQMNMNTHEIHTRRGTNFRESPLESFS
jgi:hypothetical protein